MGQRPCCRSCRHCSPPVGAELGWCRLRQLAIHPELAQDLWCHHWTARPPRLPVFAPQGTPGLEAANPNHQLSLEGLNADQRTSQS